MASVPVMYRTSESPVRKHPRPSLKALWILLCMVCFMAVGMAGFSWYSNAHQGVHTAPAPTTMTYTVHQGDTVWSIAESVNADQSQNVWDIIDEIKTMNHMSDVTIQPGQVLIIPVER